VRVREKSEKTLGTCANGADGISDIEGKVARVATSKLGNARVSNSTSAFSTMLCSSSPRYRCPLSRRGSTASSPKAVKALTRIENEVGSARCADRTVRAGLALQRGVPTSLLTKMMMLASPLVPP
jgi:hypothetical protein